MLSNLYHTIKEAQRIQSYPRGDLTTLVPSPLDPVTMAPVQSKEDFHNSKAKTENIYSLIGVDWSGDTTNNVVNPTPPPYPDKTI